MGVGRVSPEGVMMLPYRPAPRFPDLNYVERAQVGVALMIFAAFFLDFGFNCVWHRRVSLTECVIMDTVDAAIWGVAWQLYLLPSPLGPMAPHVCDIHYPWRWTALSFNCSAR